MVRLYYIPGTTVYILCTSTTSAGPFFSRISKAYWEYQDSLPERTKLFVKRILSFWLHKQLRLAKTADIPPCLLESSLFVTGF